jgi:hypothetical protein
MCKRTPSTSFLIVRDPVLSTYFTNFLTELKKLSDNTENAGEKEVQKLNEISVDIMFRMAADSHKGITEKNVAILLHTISLFTVAAEKIQIAMISKTKEVQTNLSDRALKLAQQYLSHFS